MNCVIPCSGVSSQTVAVSAELWAKDLSPLKTSIPPANAAELCFRPCASVFLSNCSGSYFSMPWSTNFDLVCIFKVMGSRSRSHEPNKVHIREWSAFDWKAMLFCGMTIFPVQLTLLINCCEYEIFVMSDCTKQLMTSAAAQTICSVYTRYTLERL